MREVTPRLEIFFEISTAAVIAEMAIYMNYPTPEFKMLGLIVFAVWGLVALYAGVIAVMEPTPSKNRECPRRGQIGVWVMLAGFPVSYIFDNSILAVLVVLVGLLLILNSIQLRERRIQAMETSEEEVLEKA